MKALTIRQPYASLIIAGVKKYETRSWAMRWQGPLAIHASKSYTGDDKFLTRMLSNDFPEVAAVVAEGLPLGVVLGIVDKAGCYRSTLHIPQMTPLERALGNYAPGRYALDVSKIIERFADPVPARGALGVWEWSG